MIELTQNEKIEILELLGYKIVAIDQDIKTRKRLLITGKEYKVKLADTTESIDKIFKQEFLKRVFNFPLKT